MKAPPAGSLSISPVSEKALTLKKGDILRVRVLKVFNPHEALLKIGTGQVHARTTLPLREGQVLRLRVVQREGTLLLQPLGRTPVSETKGILEQLRPLFEALALKGESIEPWALEKAITEDLNPLLSDLQAHAKAGHRQAQEAVQKLVLLQEEAMKQGLMVVPLPIRDEAFREALLFWRKRQVQDTEGSSTVILKLNLTNYGNIMAVFDLFSEGLSVRVFLEDRDLYRAVLADREVLKQRLKAQGLLLRTLEFHCHEFDQRDIGLVSERI